MTIVLFLSFLNIRTYNEYLYMRDVYLNNNYIIAEQMFLPSFISLSNILLFNSGFILNIKGYYTYIDAMAEDDFYPHALPYFGVYAKGGYLIRSGILGIIPSVFLSTEGSSINQGYGVGMEARGFLSFPRTRVGINARLPIISHRFYTPNFFESYIHRSFGFFKAKVSIGSEESIFFTGCIGWELSKYIYLSINTYISKTKISISPSFEIESDRVSLFYKTDFVKDLSAYHSFGIVYRFEKKKIEKENIVETRLKILAESFYNSGKVYIEEGKYTEGLEYIDKAIILDPSNDFYKKEYERFKRLKLSHEVDSLEILFKKSMERKDLIESLYLARVLSSVYGIKEYSDVADSLSKEINKKYGETGEVIGEGIRLMKAGRYEKALNYFMKALSVLPGDSTLRSYITYCNERIRARNDSLFNLASHFISLGNISEAELVFNKLRKLAPNYPLLHNLEKKIKEKKKEKIRELSSKIEDAFKNNNIERAVALISELETLVPESSLPNIYKSKLKGLKIDPEKLHLEAATYYAKNDFETAIRIWKFIKSYHPDYPRLDENIRRAEKKIRMLKSM